METKELPVKNKSEATKDQRRLATEIRISASSGTRAKVDTSDKGRRSISVKGSMSIGTKVRTTSEAK